MCVTVTCENVIHSQLPVNAIALQRT